MHRVAATPYRPRVARRHQLQFWLAAASIWALSGPARAEAPAASAPTASPTPSAVLLATSGAQGAGSALDSVIQATLEQLGIVRIVARPGLDLSAVQLVLDCVAETAQCLRAVTDQHGAEVLIAPSLARTSGELVLSFLRFDARDGEMRRVLHRQQGQALTSETLDAVPGMLRELFGLPEPKPAVEAPGGPFEDLTPMPEAPMEPPSQGGANLVGPLVLGGVGLVAIGTGIGFGISYSGAQNDYDRITMNGVKTRAEADLANDAKDRGKTHAVVADVLYGVGGATLLAAGIWLAVELSTTHEATPHEQAKLQPWLGPHQVGFVFTHRGVGL
jgi:hypothetical protein